MPPNSTPSAQFGKPVFGLTTFEKEGMPLRAWLGLRAALMWLICDAPRHLQ